MLDMNVVIINNISQTMKDKSVRQVELAEAIGVSRQTMSKMLSGARAINAVELNSIANALKVSLESLVKIPSATVEANAVKAFMGNVNTEEAKRGLEIADRLADMICFHARTRENGEAMMKPWRA